MSELQDISEVCPSEFQKLLERIPKGSQGVSIQKKFSKDLDSATNPIAPHPRYQNSTFLDIVVKP